RGVRAHAALELLRNAGWHGRESHVRRSGRQLFEAGERLVITVGVELFVARQEAIRSVHPEHEETSLVRTASGTQRAGVGPADEERVGAEAENVRSEEHTSELQ